MNWNQIQGHWKVCRGILRVKWGLWMHNNSQIVRGERQQLLGKIQARYGTSGIDVEAQVDEFLRVLGPNVLEHENTAHHEPEHRMDQF